MKDIRTIETPPGFCPLDDAPSSPVNGSTPPFLFFDSSGGRRRLLPEGVYVTIASYLHDPLKISVSSPRTLGQRA